jgi:hypothetical protein
MPNQVHLLDSNRRFIRRVGELVLNHLPRLFDGDIFRQSVRRPVAVRFRIRLGQPPSSLGWSVPFCHQMKFFDFGGLGETKLMDHTRRLGVD